MEPFYVILLLLQVARPSSEVAVRHGQPALPGESLARVGPGLLARPFSSTVPVVARLPENEVFTVVSMALATIVLVPLMLRRLPGHQS